MLHLLPLALVMGLVFGLVGQAWVRRRQEANQKNARLIAAARQAQQEENVWPPPPTKGDTDDTPGR